MLLPLLIALFPLAGSGLSGPAANASAANASAANASTANASTANAPEAHAFRAHPPAEEAGKDSVPAPAVRAPSDLRILGVVLSTEGGVPVSGVQVEVRRGGDEDGRSPRATTDDRGSFSLSGFPDSMASPVFLHLTRLGFAPTSVEVSFDEGVTVARVEVRMEPAALRLSAVSVLIERTRMVGDPMQAAGIPGSAFVLGPEDLAASRTAFDNVHDLLRKVPGVNIQDEEGYGLRPNIGLRGAGAERSGNVTLMEDGVLIAPAPYAAPAAYYFPSMGRMEGVEVRKGASQVRYGPRTLGGAVNLLAASIPEERRWRLEMGAGGDATRRGQLRAGDSGEHLGWLVQGLELRTDGFKELESGENTGFLTRDFLGRVRLTSSRNAGRYQEVELKVGLNDHTSNETYLGLTEADVRATPYLRYAGSQEDVIDTEHRQLKLRYFLQTSPSTDLVVTAYRHTFARNWYKLQTVNGRGLGAVLADPATYAGELGVLRGADSPDNALRLRANNRVYTSRGIQVVGGGRFLAGATRHNVEVGLRLHADDEDRLQWEDGYRMNAGQMILTSTGVPGSQDNRLGEAGALALFAQNEIRAGRWAFVPGVRWESIEFTRTDWAREDGDRRGEATVRRNDVTALIPGMGLTWEWNPRTHLFGGIHRGFGPPGPGADEATRVESSLNWEAGIRVRQAALGANVTAFYSDYTNILGRATLATGDSGTGDLFNGGEVRVLGLESAVDAELGRLLGVPYRIPARLSWTWSRGTFASDFQSGFGPWGTVQNGDRLPYLAEHMVSGNLGIDDGTRQVTLSWNGASAMRTEAGAGPLDPERATDRYVVFSLNGEWEIRGQGTLIGGVQNLTDRTWVVSRRPAGARPGLPRTFFAGFRVDR